jgi:predicted enzyme involved in methoxymalonyl-ACP biosynthesis
VRWLAEQGVCLVATDRQPADALRAAAPGAGAVVFLTESDFERGHVAAELPEVAVVDSGGDPALLVDALLGHGWFDLP